VSNIGETPAQIVASGVDIFMPGWLYNADSVPIQPPTEKIPPGHDTVMQFQVKRPLTVDHARLIEAQSLPLKILGSITYRDNGGVTRLTSFSRNYDYVLRRFIPVGSDDPEGDREFED
jgi:hypothetical protein